MGGGRGNPRKKGAPIMTVSTTLTQDANTAASTTAPTMSSHALASSISLSADRPPHTGQNCAPGATTTPSSGGAATSTAYNQHVAFATMTPAKNTTMSNHTTVASNTMTSTLPVRMRWHPGPDTPPKSALLASLPCELQGRFSLALQPCKLDGHEGENCTVTKCKNSYFEQKFPAHHLKTFRHVPSPGKLLHTGQNFLCTAKSANYDQEGENCTVTKCKNSYFEQKFPAHHLKTFRRVPSPGKLLHTGQIFLCTAKSANYDQERENCTVTKCKNSYFEQKFPAHHLKTFRRAPSPGELSHASQFFLCTAKSANSPERTDYLTTEKRSEKSVSTKEIAPRTARSLLSFSRATLCCCHSFEQDSSLNLARKGTRKAPTRPSSPNDSGPWRQSVLANVHNPFYFSNQAQTPSSQSPRATQLTRSSPRPSTSLPSNPRERSPRNTSSLVTPLDYKPTSDHGRQQFRSRSSRGSPGLSQHHLRSPIAAEDPFIEGSPPFGNYLANCRRVKKSFENLPVGTSNWGNNTQHPTPRVSAQPPPGRARPAVVNLFVWQPPPAPILGPGGHSKVVVMITIIGHSKTLAEDVMNCRDYLLPPSKSALLASLPVALLPCKLGSKEGKKDVDKLLRGCFLDNSKYPQWTPDITGEDLLPPSKSALLASLDLLLKDFDKLLKGCFLDNSKYPQWTPRPSRALPGSPGSSQCRCSNIQGGVRLYIDLTKRIIIRFTGQAEWPHCWPRCGSGEHPSEDCKAEDTHCVYLHCLQDGHVLSTCSVLLFIEGYPPFDNYFDYYLANCEVLGAA
jgi:hypothetical protein